MAKKGAAAPPPEDDDPSAPFWMTTFSDMATLLLTFFIMIVSMSTVEVKKFQEAISYFPGRTSFLLEDAVLPPTKKQVVATESAGGEDITDMVNAERFESLLEYLEAEGLQDKVQVNLTEQGLHVVIVDSIMFASGEAHLLSQSREVLTQVAKVLGESAKSVVVEGHTDDRPIATSRFPTNWELSGARAFSVVRFLLGEPSTLDPSGYVGIGYGEFRPVESNATAAGRAKNRRVEILFSWEPWQNSSNPAPRAPNLKESLPREAARPS
ncbi:MAG: OmpA family protein [Rhodothermales bacterium]|nr:OmpA family protein [Rhodothermales bacterium]